MKTTPNPAPESGISSQRDAVFVQAFDDAMSVDDAEGFPPAIDGEWLVMAPVKHSADKIR